MKIITIITIKIILLISLLVIITIIIMSIVTFAGVGLISATFGGVVMEIVQSSSKNNPNWYDFYHNYLRFGEQYTPIIDDLLIDGASQNKAKIKNVNFENGRFLPGLGSHYYYPKEVGWFRKYFVYVGFYKIKIKDSDNRYFYQGFVPPRCGNLMNIFLSMMLNPPGEIIVNHIDSSDTQIRVITKRVKYSDPLPHQQYVMDRIQKLYEDNKSNKQVLLAGERGTGKTFIARLLKKKLDADNGVNCQIYDNFNPSQVGLDIVTIALSKATRYAPIILVVNEADTIFDDVKTESHNFDPRTLHTRSISTFHNMLDSISDTPHVIAIYTTEKTIDDLRNDPAKTSMFRKGRIDSYYLFEKNGDDVVTTEVV